MTIVRFSRAVMWSMALSVLRSGGKYPMPCLIELAGSPAGMSMLPTVTVPASLGLAPNITPSASSRPDPVSPYRPTISPLLTSTERSRSWLWRSDLTERAAMAGCGCASMSRVAVNSAASSNPMSSTTNCRRSTSVAGHVPTRRPFLTTETRCAKSGISSRW